MAKYRVTFKALDTIECDVVANSFGEAEDAFKEGNTISSWDMLKQGEPSIIKIEKIDK